MENEMMNYPRMFGSFETPRILKEGFGYEGEVFAREGFEWFSLEWVDLGFRAGLSDKLIGSFSFQSGINIGIGFL